MKRFLRRFSMLLMLLVFLSSAQIFAAAKEYVYFGKKLTGFDRSAYNQIAANSKKGIQTTSIDVSGSFSYRTDLAELLVDDYPRIFWGGGLVLERYTSYANGTYRRVFNYEVTERWKGALKKRSAFNKKVNAVVKKVKKKAKGKNEAQRARIALDYIAANCRYVYSAYDQSPYGVFVKKKAVCAGYARSYKLLCDELGIKCICVSGTVDGEPHMVNFVRVKKKWYYVDPTWCDNGSAADDTYFLLGSKSSGCHVTHCNGIKLPKLAANDYPRFY